MTLAEIKELSGMGFTNDQILTLAGAGAAPGPDQGQGQNQEQEKKQDQEKHQDQGNDAESVNQKIGSLEQKINDFIRRLQQDNLKTAMVDVLPDADLNKKVDAAMSELIRPTIKKED